jgi:hypothetical protein
MLLKTEINLIVSLKDIVVFKRVFTIPSSVIQHLKGLVTRWIRLLCPVWVVLDLNNCR